MLTRRSSAHVRIGVGRRRHERLLDRAGAGPAQEVLRRAGLVVGARGAATPERLLPDDRTGGLVVDVEVAGCEPQPVAGVGDDRPVLGDDRAGEPERRAPTPSGPAPCRTGGRGRRAPTGSGRSTPWRTTGRSGCRSPAPSGARTSPRESSYVPPAITLTPGVACARSMASLCLANARSSMTAPMKFEKSVTSPWVSALVMDDEVVLDDAPEAARHVGARGGGALLALVLERPTDHRRPQHVRVGATGAPG